MMNDFYTNLTTITNNLEDIAFTKYATIININNDGTCTAKEDEEEGLTHENINTLGNNLRVGDKVVLGFIDNSIYNPVVLSSMNKSLSDSYSKEELDGFVDCLINRLDTGGDDGGGDVVGFDVDIDMRFTGVSGRDDSITLSANLIYVEE
jgi:hypothetical protein